MPNIANEPEINNPTLTWRRYSSYQDAREMQRIIYLFEWNDKPFYWGIAERSAFGVRYNVGYRHLIEGALRHGGKLYIATVNENSGIPLVTIENYLMVTYGHEMNSRINTDAMPLSLSHQGEPPRCLLETTETTGIIDTVSPDIFGHDRTLSHGNPFSYQITPSELIINRGANLDIRNAIGGCDLIRVLEKIDFEFGGDTFPLDNSLTPSPDRELGFGTTIRSTLEATPSFSQVASQLAKLFCEASIFELTRGRGDIGKAMRYRLIFLPSTWAELRSLLER